MQEPRILVVLPQPLQADPAGSSLATELRTILQRPHAYNVELRDGPLPATPAGVHYPADLIIPILTAPKPQSRALLSTLLPPTPPMRPPRRRRRSAPR